MLENIRAHSSGWVAKILLGLVVVVFSFWGIESYFVAQSQTGVAKVGDTEISQQDFQNEINRLRQQANNPQSGLQAEDFAKPAFRRQVLDGLINRAVLRHANDDLGVAVTDSMVRDEIAKVPAFQVDGKFDPTTYQAILVQQGMSPQGFQEQVRQDLATQIIPQAITGSALATAAEVDTYLRLSSQTRDVHYVQLPPPELPADAISDADVKAYYEAHTDNFMNPETVTIQYLEVSAADMEADVTPTDAEIEARYEQEKGRFVVPEQRLVSHILVSVPANATPDEQKKALARADEIKQELTDGADFAALAKKDSDDLGSRQQGGSLGWIEPGMTNEAFDAAAFSLPVGKISDPVLSPQGYHLIEVEQIKAGHAKDLAEVKDQIERELLGSARERKYNDLAGTLVDLVYANPDSLQPAATKLGLTIHTAGPFSREDGTGIAANPDVVAAAFSNQVLTQGMTSNAINIGSNDMVVLRASKHTAAAPKAFDTVKADAHKALIAERTSAKAKENAEAALASLEKGETLDVLAKGDGELTVHEEKGLERFPPKLPPAVMSEVFKMPHPSADEPTFASVANPDGSYTLVQLDAVHPGDPSKVSDAERKAIAAQLSQMHGTTETMAMLQIMRAGAKVSINEDQLRGEQPLE